MRPLDVCLFDLDGTLVDSIELIFRSYEHAFSERGFEPLARAELLGYLGRTLPDCFRCFADDPREVEALIASYRRFNLVHHDDLVTAYPGTQDTLELLRARGVRLGVVTSKKRETALRGLGVCGFETTTFDVFVALEDCARHKPDPEPLERALATLGAQAAGTGYVGDSPHDVAAANGARMRAFVAGWGPFSPAHFDGLRVERWLAEPGELAQWTRPRADQRARE